MKRKYITSKLLAFAHQVDATKAAWIHKVVLALQAEEKLSLAKNPILSNLNLKSFTKEEMLRWVNSTNEPLQKSLESVEVLETA